MEGALIFVRMSNDYSCWSPMYRAYTKGKHRALLLADKADAQNYCDKHNLLLVHDETE